MDEIDATANTIGDGADILTGQVPDLLARVRSVERVSTQEAAGMLGGARTPEPWLVRNAEVAMAEHMNSIIQITEAALWGDRFLGELRKNAKGAQKAVNDLRRLLPILIYYERKADLAGNSESKLTFENPSSQEARLLAATFAAHGRQADELTQMLNALVDVPPAFRPKGAGWHWAARWLLNAYRENVAAGRLGREGPTVVFIQDCLRRCGLGHHEMGAIEAALRARVTPRKRPRRRGSENRNVRGEASGETRPVV